MDERRCRFTREEREWVIRSVRDSQWLSGVYVSRYTVARLLDELENEPLPQIGEVEDERKPAGGLRPQQPVQ